MRHDVERRIDLIAAGKLYRASGQLKSSPLKNQRTSGDVDAAGEIDIALGFLCRMDISRKLGNEIGMANPEVARRAQREIEAEFF